MITNLFQLYSWVDQETCRVYARIFLEEGFLKLGLTAEALTMGMLDTCVAAALVLKSGRDIDGQHPCLEMETVGIRHSSNFKRSFTGY